MTASKIITAYEAHLEAVAKREELNEFDVEFVRDEDNNASGLSVSKQLNNGLVRQFVFFHSEGFFTCASDTESIRKYRVASWIVEDRKIEDGKKMEVEWSDYKSYKLEETLPTEDELVSLIVEIMNR